MKGKAQKEVVQAHEETVKAQKEAAAERENRIRDVVSMGKHFGVTKEDLVCRIRKIQGIDQEEAMEKVELYWNRPEAAENEI